MKNNITQIRTSGNSNVTTIPYDVWEKLLGKESGKARIVTVDPTTKTIFMSLVEPPEINVVDPYEFKNDEIKIIEILEERDNGCISNIGLFNHFAGSSTNKTKMKTRLEIALRSLKKKKKIKAVNDFVLELVRCE